MRTILLIFAMLLPSLLWAQNTVTVTASKIYSNYPASSSAPALLPAGTAIFQATNAKGVPISYQVGGGGTQTSFPTTCGITVGALIEPCTLANVATANPQNFCYNLTIKNTNNQVILGGANSGYTCLQPTVTNTWCATATCNLDNYQPTVPQSVFTLNTPTTTTLGGIFSGDCGSGKVAIGYNTSGTPDCVVQSGGGGSGVWGAITGFLPNQVDLANALALLAPINSPLFTGVPLAPTPAPGDSTQRIATTAFVTGNYAPINSPAFTGTPTAPAPGSSDNSTKVATTSFVQAQNYAPLASPALTGVPTAPTPSLADSSTKLATTAFVMTQSFAPINSPALTGTPTAPTPTISDSTTKIATTAWVNEQGFGSGTGNVTGPGSSTVNHAVGMGGTNGKSIIDLGFGFPLAPAEIGTLVAGSNGLATSATTDATNAANITSGTLPHGRLPALLSSDIPNNAANTTGTSAALSAASALPPGTTATTQSTGDSTTAVATDQFVKNQGYGTGTMSSLTCGTGLTGGTVTTTGTCALATALPNGQTATTQTTGDNTTKVATDAFVIANAGGSGPPVGTAAQIPIVNTGATAYAPQTVSGDASLSIAGVMTVTKTGGVAFGPLATATTPVSVPNGGSGAATITGVLKGNGTSPYTAAAGTDIAAPFTGCSGNTTALTANGTCQPYINPSPTVSQNVVQPVSTALSINNLSNTRTVTASYNWTASANIPAGSYTLNFTTCPIGLDTTNIVGSANGAMSYVRIVQGGTSEIAAVTGGTCVAGTTGTLVFTAKNSYSPGTVSSANSGIQEAINDACGVTPTTARNCRVIIPPGSNLNIYATVFEHCSNCLVDANGALLTTSTRDRAWVLGDLNSSSHYGHTEFQGGKFSSSLNVNGCTITNTARASNVDTITVTGTCPIVTGDTVNINFTDSPNFWGSHGPVTVSGSTITYASPSGTIASAATPGTIIIQNAAMEDNALPGILNKFEISNLSGGNYSQGIVADNDQAAEYDNTNYNNGLLCNATHCGSFVYSAGSTASTPVIRITNPNWGMQCAGNGITDYANNSVSISGGVIQGFGMWGVNTQVLLGSFGGTALSNVYWGEGSGPCTNPYIGSVFGAAGVIFNGDQPLSITGGEGPVANHLPQFANTGTTQYNYFVIAKDTTSSIQSPPLLAGFALTNGSGTISGQFPRIPPFVIGDTVTYDIIRMQPNLTLGNDLPSFPVTGACTGGSTTACGSIITAQAQCSGLVCTFSDTASANTTSYTLPSAGPSWAPILPFWPAAILVTGTGSSNFSSSPIFSDVEPSDVVTVLGNTYPTLYVRQCGDASATGNINFGGAWEQCLEGKPNVANVGGLLLQDGSGGATGSGIKGRLNFESLNTGTGFVNPHHIITLVDSNSSKTLATIGFRPPNDANDTFIGTDNTAVPSGVQLAFGAPVAISNYIGNVGNNTSYLERLTATLKTFNVPILHSTYTDITGIAAPANPASGNGRFYFNTSTGLLACLTSSGGSCMPAGGGGTITAVVPGTGLTGGGSSGSVTVNFTFPSSGVPNSTGTAWGTSYAVGTAASDLVQLNGSAQLPAVSAALLTNFPTLNQNTTGTAGGLSANITESQVTNLTTDLAARVLTTTTVNTHALSSNVVISASDITTGTLPHAQLPALVSGDIPNNAANTSGTAANLSGTPALPNGTTGTTQTTGDNTTKLATDAFVLANSTGITLGTAAQIPIVNSGATAYAPQTISGDISSLTAAGVATVASLHLSGPTTNAILKETSTGNAVASAVTESGGTLNTGGDNLCVGSSCNFGINGTGVGTAYNWVPPNLSSPATGVDVWVGTTGNETTNLYPLLGTDTNIPTASTLSSTPFTSVCTDSNGGLSTSGCSSTVPVPLLVNGQVTTPQLGANTVYVDGTVNKSLAAAVFSAPCYGANTHGCYIVDDFPEVIQIWPLLQSQNITIQFNAGVNSTNAAGVSYGDWRFTVPLIAASERIYGMGWPINTANGTNGTVLKACDGEVLCNSLYSPNKVPTLTATPAGTPSTTGGTLAAGSYFIKWVPMVNLNTAPDTILTSALPPMPTSTAVVAGKAYADATTNCTSAACTEVVITPGTTGSSAPSWSAGLGGKTQSGTATFVNIGRITQTVGSAGMGLPGPESAAITTTGTTGSIAFTTPSIPSYPSCSRSGVAYTTGQMVTGPFGVNSHSYRVIGAGTTTSTSCNMSTTASSQTTDAGVSTIVWQETGAVNNFLPVVGYVPYIGTASGAEYSQALSGVVNGTCSSLVQVANQAACAPGSTFTFTTYANNNSRPVPLIDWTAPLGMIENTPSNSTNSSVDNPNTVISNLVLDADNIASEALVNYGSQEGTRIEHLELLGGDETPFAMISPHSQNSGFDDLNIGNQFNGNTIFYQRVAGCIFIDGRGGNPVKRFGQYTCIPQNAPTGMPVQPKGIYATGAAGVDMGLALGGHFESVQDGFYFNGGNAYFSGANGNATVTNSYVHLASGVNEAEVMHIAPTGSAQSVQDDNITTGTGNCNSNNSLCFTGAGMYLLGPADGNGNRQRITNAPDIQQQFTGGLKTANVQTFSDCASSASPAVCGANTTGSVVIAIAATTVVVNTTAVTANSEIMLTPDESLGTKLGVTCNTTGATALSALGVTARTPGTSFTVSTSAASVATHPVCLSFTITN